MKRLTASLLALLMVLSLSGCGAEDETENDINTTSAVTEETEQTSSETEIETEMETTTETEAETTTEETTAEPEEEIVPFECEYTYSSNGTATITKYTGSETDVVVPETIDGYTVTVIGEKAFYKKSSIKSIILPETVTSINNSAFSGCESLKELIIPSSVSTIQHYAFEDTPWYSLHKDGYFVIADNCLIEYTGKETEVTVPDGVRLICNYAFYDNRDIISVTLPETVTKIGDGAFSDCRSLANINLPDSITFIGADAFQGCRGLVNIRLPESLKTIGDEAFAGCYNLESIEVSENMVLTSVGQNAFGGSGWETNLYQSGVEYIVVGGALVYGKYPKNVVIPDAVNTIAAYAFKGSVVTSVTMSDSVTEIGAGAFDSCWYLESVTLSNSLTTINNDVFSDCRLLSEVNLPDNLQEIGSNAFYNCINLAEITIPDSVTWIGSDAFQSCDNLSRVTLPDGISYLASDAFDKNVIVTYKGTDYVFGSEFEDLYAAISGE